MRRRREPTAGQAAPADGREWCPLCGQAVPVGDDGRCDLGHRVRTSAAAAETTQPLVVDPADVPAAPAAGLAAAGVALGRPDDPAAAAAPAGIFGDVAHDAGDPADEDDEDDDLDVDVVRPLGDDDDDPSSLDYGSELDW